MQRRNPNALLLITLLASTVSPTTSQSVFRVSKTYDSIEAPAANSFPGLHGGFRQQILISSTRLVGLSGKSLNGMAFRRDLHHRGPIVGGLIDVEITISPARHSPERADEVFADNLTTAAVVVFRGRVSVPNSPALGATPSPWDASNSVDFPFSPAFAYTGGDLCVDVAARPVAGSEPELWLVDSEYGSYSGLEIPIGVSCSDFATISGQTLSSKGDRLQIGSTLRLMALGRPGSSPLILFGGRANPNVDLTSIGATGCSQYIDPLLVIRRSYSKPSNPSFPSSLYFDAKIPFDRSLQGRSIFAQTADDESSLPLTKRSNPAGLTTSNGLELKFSTVGPDLGLTTISSRRVGAAVPMPTRGVVDVSMGPVLRFRY